MKILLLLNILVSSKSNTISQQFVKLLRCSGSSPTHPPHHLPRKVIKIRSFCNQNGKDGHYMKLQWIPPKFPESKYVDWYQLSLIQSDNLDKKMCFNVSRTESDVSIFLKDGLKLDISYLIGIVAFPTGPFQVSTQMDLCRNGSITTTIQPTTNVTTTEHNTIGSSSKQDKKPKDLGLIIAASTASIALLIIVVVVIYLFKIKHCGVIKPLMYSKRQEEKKGNGKTVYVSHCTEEKDNKGRLIKLLNNLETFGINICIDLCNQVPINNAGGLPYWVPSKMYSVDKILLVITPMYLKALSSTNKEEEIQKVHLEFHYIRNLPYYNCHQIPQLVIMLDGVKPRDIPIILQGRYLCQFPKDCHEDNNSFRTLLGLLLDIEPLQIIR